MSNSRAMHCVPRRKACWVLETSHRFLALDVQKATEQHQGSTELVQGERFSAEQVRRMIVENEITSGVMVAALFRALLVL